MSETTFDLNDPIVYHRARNYRRLANGKLQNVPYVDNSYKWSGGGYLSNVEDLVKFGQSMITSATTEHGYLKSSTVSTLWTPNEITIGKVSRLYPDVSYALGWCIQPDKNNQKYAVFHTGWATTLTRFLQDCENQQAERQIEDRFQGADEFNRG